MSSSNKTVRRGGTLSRRIGNASKAACSCILYLFDERAISEEGADKAAEELFLLSCEVGDAIKTARAERELDARGEASTSVSRETLTTSEGYDDVQATIPY